MANRIWDLRPSHPSASHAVNFTPLTGSDDDKPLAGGQCPPSSDVASHAADAPSVTTGRVLSEANSVSATRSTLQMSQPSVAAASDGTAKSTSPSKSKSGGFKRSGSRKTLGVKRGSNLSRSLRRLVLRVRLFLPLGR